LRARGTRCSRKRVARLMRAAGLSARRPRRAARTTDSRHALPVAPNLLGRDFTAPAPDLRWAADITYVPTAEGWLYLAVILDLFSRRVVGHACLGDARHDPRRRGARAGVRAQAAGPRPPPSQRPRLSVRERRVPGAARTGGRAM